MVFHIAVCSTDAALRSGLERQCMEYFARRQDACIVQQLPDADALLRRDAEGERFDLYLIELAAVAAPAGLSAAAELRRRGRRAPLAFAARTAAHAYSAFRVDAMQYLLLPVHQQELSALLARATEPSMARPSPWPRPRACGCCPMPSSSIWSAPTMWCVSTCSAGRM